MSVVIIGGHDRMVCQYKKICKEHKCKAKVFTQMPAKLSSQIGSPDLIIPVSYTHLRAHETEVYKRQPQDGKMCGSGGGAQQSRSGKKSFQQWQRLK